MNVTRLHKQSAQIRDNLFVDFKPVQYNSDSNLQVLKPIRPITARVLQKSKIERILPVESPLLRPLVSYEVPSCVKRRNMLFTIFLTSLTIGVCIGRLGAKSVDEFDDYLIKIKEQEQMDPYR